MTTTIAILLTAASLLFACTVKWGEVGNFLLAAIFAAAESLTEKISSLFK
jgi:hypothetical protein